MAVGSKGGVRVEGYRECMRALNKTEKGTKKAVRDGLKKAATPVALSARRKLVRYSGASTSTIGPSVTTKGVFVTQRAKKRTGKRPDFGGLQMRRGLIPALHEHEDETAELVRDAFMDLAHSTGL